MGKGLVFLESMLVISVLSKSASLKEPGDDSLLVTFPSAIHKGTTNSKNLKSHYKCQTWKLRIKILDSMSKLNAYFLQLEWAAAKGVLFCVIHTALRDKDKGALQ